MARPKEVRVGPYKWKIVWDHNAAARFSTEDEDTLGATRKQEMTIFITTQIPRELQRETLLHELMHACFAVSGSPMEHPGKDPEETAVSALSPVLYGVMLDNPKLFAWIAGA